MGENEAKLKDVTEAIKRMISGSIPYVSKHKAFLITEESWTELAEFVYPRMRLLDEVFAKQRRGEVVSDDELREALEIGVEDSQ